MGTRSLTLLFACLSSLDSVQAGISLQPHESQYTLEGIKLKELAFFDGGSREVTYQQPPGWEYSGNSDRLSLRPPGKSRAEATISRVALPQSGDAGATGPETLVAEAIASVPQGSTGVKIISQGKNPLKISGKESFQLVMTFTLLGETFTRSISFLNREHEQLRFQLTAPAGDFEQLQREFQASLCSWRNL
jgi:hypothetical protein